MNDRVLILDPSGRVRPGTFLASTDNSTAQLVREGAVVLPVRSDLAGKGIGGCPYTLVHWGAGWTFNANQGERGCPILLYVPGPEVSVVHWCASVERIDGEHLSGSVRLVTTPEQPGGMQGGLVAQNGSVPLVDKYAARYEARSPGVAYPGPATPQTPVGQTWTIGGSYDLRVTTGGYLGLCLYAVARGLRVRWSAASLA